MATIPTVTLNNGLTMPQLGFGVFQVPDAEAAAAVSTALAAGYRSIDTAAIYGNEQGTGAALAASGIARADLFITTKLWNGASTRWTAEAVEREFEASLNRLGLDYVDLYLIHWPHPMREDYLTIWRAFEDIARSGRAKAVGVSNFQPPQLRRLIAESEIVPAVNQIELHPRLQQAELRALHASLGIATEAWSPLGQGSLLTDPVIGKIAAKHGRTAAQVVLNWHLQLGNIVIPKSVTPSRIRENLEVFDFTLDDQDRTLIAGLDSGTRVGPDPDTFDPK